MEIGAIMVGISGNAYWKRGVGNLYLRGYLERMLDEGIVEKIEEAEENNKIFNVYFRPENGRVRMADVTKRFPDLKCDYY